MLDVWWAPICLMKINHSSYRTLIYGHGFLTGFFFLLFLSKNWKLTFSEMTHKIITFRLLEYHSRLWSKKYSLVKMPCVSRTPSLLLPDIRSQSNNIYIPPLLFMLIWDSPLTTSRCRSLAIFSVVFYTSTVICTKFEPRLFAIAFTTYKIKAMLIKVSVREMH